MKRSLVEEKECFNGYLVELVGKGSKGQLVRWSIRAKFVLIILTTLLPRRANFVARLGGWKRVFVSRTLAIFFLEVYIVWRVGQPLSFFLFLTVKGGHWDLLLLLGNGVPKLLPWRATDYHLSND